jgi:hypothetical protein
MSQRISAVRLLLIAAVFVGLSGGKLAAWQLNPFASDDAKSVKRTPAKKSPNALDKMATGTKNFFNKTGEALHLKKPAPRKPPVIVAAKPRVAPPPYREKKSWIPSWLRTEEPERSTSVKDWIGTTKQVTP